MTQSDDNREPDAPADPGPADAALSGAGAADPASPPAAPTRRLRLSWGGATHHGRVRAANQDALFADRGLFVVADGMGGHRGGEVASQIAVRAMAGGRHATMDEFVESVSASNRAVWDHSVENPELKGMGTTLTAIAVLGDGRPPELGVVNVGDSRIYRWRDGELQQLTDDHSYVAELIRRGQLSENEAATHPYRNMLTRAIGVADAVEVDRWAIAPEAGDRFVLCSDGLVNELDDLEIRQAVGSIHEPAQLARTLIDRANVAGGRDNVTVVIVFVEVDEVEPPLPPPPVDDAAPVSEPTGVLPSIDEGRDVAAPQDDAEPELDAEGSTAPVDEADAAVEDVPYVAATTGVLAAPLTDLPDLGEGDTLEDVFADGDADVASAIAAAPLDDGADTGGADAPDADATGDEPASVASTEAEHGHDLETDAQVGAVAVTTSPFDAPADDDLPDVTARNDALSGYELPELDGAGPLPWIDDEGAGTAHASDEQTSARADQAADVETDDAAPLIVVGQGSTAEAAVAWDEPAADATRAPFADLAEPTPDAPGVFDDEADVTTNPNSTIVFADPGIVMREPEDPPVEERTGWRAPVGVTLLALVAFVVGIAALVAAFYAVGVYARGTYHVTFAGDEVVIYQGRSGGVLWFDPTLEEGSGIFRSQLPEGTVADVASIVEVSSLEAARTYVDGIRPAEPQPADAAEPDAAGDADADAGADADDASSDATASADSAGA